MNCSPLAQVRRRARFSLVLNPRSWRPPTDHPAASPFWHAHGQGATLRGPLGAGRDMHVEVAAMSDQALLIPARPPRPDAELSFFRFLRAVRTNALTMWPDEVYEKDVARQSFIG